MTNSIIFVDSRVAGNQSLIDSITEPSEVFALDRTSVDVVAEYLATPFPFRCVNASTGDESLTSAKNGEGL